MNSTTSGSVVIAGHLDGSSCEGGTFTTKEQTWRKAVVRYIYEITLFEYRTTVDTNTDTINLKGSFACPYSQKQCFDYK